MLRRLTLLALLAATGAALGSGGATAPATTQWQTAVPLRARQT